VTFRKKEEKNERNKGELRKIKVHKNKLFKRKGARTKVIADKSHRADNSYFEGGHSSYGHLS